MIIEEIKRRVANGDDLEAASGAVLDIMQAAAADERAKIVAWLKAPLIRLNNFDGFFRASDLATAEDLDDAATKIEAVEHVK